MIKCLNNTYHLLFGLNNYIFKEIIKIGYMKAIILLQLNN